MALTASDAARALALSRPRLTVSCAVCGQAFSAPASSGSRTPRYCSTLCRSAAYRARKRGGPARAYTRRQPQPEKS